MQIVITHISRNNSRSTTERCLPTILCDKTFKQYKDMTHAVAYCIAEDMLPLSVVRNGFRKLLSVAGPCYVVLGHKHFLKMALC